MTRVAVCAVLELWPCVALSVPAHVYPSSGGGLQSPVVSNIRMWVQMGSSIRWDSSQKVLFPT
jgi:hypothetical protein